MPPVFKDPLIRYAFTYLFVNPEFACTSLFFFLAGLHIRGTGFPQGSSLSLARTIERTFLDLNGKIEYREKGQAHRGEGRTGDGH